MPAYNDFEIDRRETRLPVVRVDDGRTLPLARREFEGRADQHRKAAGIVGILALRGSVKALAIVQPGLVDQNGPRALGQWRLEKSDVRVIAADRDRIARDERAGGGPAVSRDDQGHVPPEARQRDRQRAEDVGQSAGLRKRHRLGANHQDRWRRHSRGRRSGSALGFQARTGVFLAGGRVDDGRGGMGRFIVSTARRDPFGGHDTIPA